MNQLRKLLASLTWRQRITIGVSVAILGLGLWLFTRWSHERDFKPLYVNLSAEDAGAVMQKLREENVEYRVDESGTGLRVPSGRVAEMRLKMAGAGLPKTGRIGFELFDKSNFGLTEFAEQINYRRAIEGELERSIASLSEIEHARVHISLPKDSVFLEAKQEAKASVVIGLRPGAKLSPQNGASITYLVASAVERLSPEQVTVIDTRGNLLVRPHKVSTDPDAGQPEADLEYRQKTERDLVLKISSTLEPLLGPEKFRAGASVDLDFSSADQSEESFDPSRSAMVTAQKTEDATGIVQPAGVPGTASNLPRPAIRPAGSGGGTTRRTENITYQTSRTVRRTRIPQGAIRRMSLSVLVDQDVRWEGRGTRAKRILEPPSADKLKTIRGLVAAATGFSEARGDQLIVETLPFESTLAIQPPPEPGPAAPNPTLPLPAWLLKFVSSMPIGMLIGLGLAAGIIVAAPVVILLMRRRKKVTVGEVTADKALPEGSSAEATFEDQLASRAATQEKLNAEALLALKLPPAGTKKSDILTKHLKKSVKADPAVSAQLLRTWIHENET